MTAVRGRDLAVEPIHNEPDEIALFRDVAWRDNHDPHHLEVTVTGRHGRERNRAAGTSQTRPWARRPPTAQKQ
jgi:hypothetical protein